MKIVRKAMCFSRSLRLKAARRNAEQKRNRDNDSMKDKFIQNMNKIDYSEIRKKAILQLRNEMGSSFREKSAGRFIDVYVYRFAKTGSFM